MKRILPVLVGTLVCMLGCQDAATPPSNEGATVNEADAGELHNKIAHAFAEKLDEATNGSYEPISRKVFVKLMVEASNEVLGAEGVAHTATAKEINGTLNELVNLRNRGVFDIYSSRRGNPKHIIDDWEKRGIVTGEEAIAVRARLAGEPNAFSLPASDRVKAVDSIYFASMELWSDPNFSLTPTRTRTTVFDAPPDKESLRFQLDSIFFLFGAFIFSVPGGTIAGTGASLIFEMFPPPDGYGSWNCSDFCNMA